MAWIVSVLFDALFKYGWRFLPLQKKLLLGEMIGAKVCWRLLPNGDASAYGTWQEYVADFEPLPTLYHKFLVTFDNHARGIARQQQLPRQMEFALVFSGYPEQQVPLSAADIEFIFKRAVTANGRSVSPNGLLKAMEGIVLPRGGI